MKALVENVIVTSAGAVYVEVSFFNGSNLTESQSLLIAADSWTSNDQIIAALVSAIITYSNSQSYGITSADILNPLMGASQSTDTRSIVTGTGATGFQVSANKSAFVNYSVTITTTATIGGNASGTIVLEIAPTNSATAGDWVEIARYTNGQAISLAIALQSTQTLAGTVSGFIPAGYYAKLRSINNSGTPTYTFNSGQKILL